ncbi:50S ribosomal protein L23 [Thioalkalivibrio thiocyanodenitrificans]|uniref:50S ribosomal protein L23 n=1 Tax=Thioalkalivibrio thiocyanodenitrificans TaxID=243063 RepID=UPI00037E06BE|nr:50S ribosomal protein L23 [Thioalkalivibrio thiocyanodenitrificans]
MNEERLLKVLVGPHVSEKATLLADAANQQVFRVATDATRDEVKAAVEKLFEVEVTSVRVVNMKGKSKRFGARQGRRANWKKAYVTLAEGQDIAPAGSE